MILLFNIEYRTNWGEEVRVSGSIPELGNEHPDKAFAATDHRRYPLDCGSKHCNAGRRTCPIQLPYLPRRPAYTCRVEQPAPYALPFRNFQENVPDTGLLEKPAGAAVFLYFRLYGISSGTPRTQRRTQRTQEGAADKGIRALHRQ